MRFAVICLALLAIAAIGIVVAEDQSVPDGTIYGHVYDARTKQPISGAWVYCQETKCSKQLTDSNGYYAIENCFSPSSNYAIECTKNGYPTAKNTAQTDSSGKAKVDFNLGTPNPPPNPTPAVSWKKTFGGSKFDWACSVQKTDDCGYIIGGYTQSYGTSAESVWLIKTDIIGNEEWNSTFPRFSGTEGCAVEQTSDGGFIIADALQPIQESANKVISVGKILLTKTDSKGSKLWEKTFSASGFWFIVPTIHRANDGGFVISCSRMSYNGDKCEVWVIKTDENGIKQWDTVLEGATCNKGCAVQQTKDYGYIIACCKSYHGTDNQDAWLIKTDSQGNKLWDKIFGGPGVDEAWAVQNTNDNGFVIAGSKDSNAWLIKTDAQGNLLWERTFEGSTAFAVQNTNDGGYIIAGSAKSLGVDNIGSWLIKADSEGNKEWEKTFEGLVVDYPFSIQQTIDGGYIIACNDESHSDIWLIKTDSEGNVEG